MNVRARYLPISFVVLAIAAISGVSIALATGTPADDVPTGTPSPAFNPTAVIELDNDAERARSSELSPGYSIPATGPETAGTSIKIGNKIVQLPDDTWIEANISHIFCVEGQMCPPTPYYVLNRNGSTIEVDSEGKIWHEVVLEEDALAFEFLKESLE